MEVDPVSILKARLAKCSQEELARELGVSQPIICMSVLGTREPSPKILKALGIEKRVTYHVNGTGDLPRRRINRLSQRRRAGIA